VEASLRKIKPREGTSPESEHGKAGVDQAPPMSPSSVTLTITGGPHKGQNFTFTEHDTFLVGRSKRANFQLPKKDMYVSRAHFLVEANPPRCRLLDLRSHNGTYVNGHRVTSVELRDADVVRAGRTIFRVAIQRANTEPATEIFPLSP